MKPFNYYENLDNYFQPLSSSGAFLLVNDKNGKANAMTIGWGTVGLIWYKPVLTILIRKARYTHELLEHNSNFTVSVPKQDELKKALSVCGSKSGRNMDKIKECNLNTAQGKLKNTSIITDCSMFYECTVIHKNEINSKELSEEIKDKYYGDNDFHTVYFGEIIHSYKA